jgi:hypothetical protein
MVKINLRDEWQETLPDAPILEEAKSIVPVTGKAFLHLPSIHHPNWNCGSSNKYFNRRPSSSILGDTIWFVGPAAVKTCLFDLTSTLEM